MRRNFLTTLLGVVVMISLLPVEVFAGTSTDYTFRAKSYPQSRDRNYRVYVPSSYDGSEAYPMVMVLHGCKETNMDAFDEFGWTDRADEEGIIVVYPFITSYDGSRNQNCWGFWSNAFDHHLHEGGGEVEDLHRIGLEVENNFNVNPDMRYITGLSSGGAMTVVAAVAYNEYWAAAAPIAGLPYYETSSAVNLGSQSWDGSSCGAYPTYSSVATMVSAMNSELDDSRLIPIFIMQSTHDCTVLIKNSENIRDTWLSAWSINTTADSTVNGSDESVSWTHKKYEHNSVSVVETFFYNGPGWTGFTPADYTNPTHWHYWPGDGSGIFANPTGPSASSYSWDFFKQHTLSGEAAPTCEPNCDTTAPSAPSGLSAGTATENSVALSWSANGEGDLAGYQVFISTTSGGTYTSVGNRTSSTSTTITGLQASTTYYFKLKAFDTSGNASALSSYVSKATSATTFSCSGNSATAQGHIDAGRAVPCGIQNMYACAKGSNEEVGIVYDTTTTKTLNQQTPGYYSTETCGSGGGGGGSTGACEYFTSTNTAHVSAGRASMSSSGYWWWTTDSYEADGSDDYMGSSGLTQTTLYEGNDSNFYTADPGDCGTAPEAEAPPVDEGEDCAAIRSTNAQHIEMGRATACGIDENADSVLDSACAADDGADIGANDNVTYTTLYDHNGDFTIQRCDGSLGNEGAEGGSGDGGTGDAGTWSSVTKNGMGVLWYAPGTTPGVDLLNGKRALHVSLHGCSQKNTDIKGGNWEPSAQKYGSYVALPNVPGGGVIAGCWEYYGTSHTRSNYYNNDLLGMVSTLLSENSDIDPDQVYLSGLSSGGGQTGVLTCLAPDVFAATGNNAGPTIGTASGDIGSVSTNKTTATSLCNSFAGSYKNFFNTQIASMVYGTSDYTVAQGYNTLNGEVMAGIYGASKDTGTQSITGQGEVTTYSDANGERVQVIKVTGMGHAWPGGGGTGGSYVDTTHVNYPAVFSKWVYENNRRVDRTPAVSDSDAPAAPTGLVSASTGKTAVSLQWEPVSAPDLAGYAVSFKLNASGTWTTIQSASDLLKQTNYTVGGLTAGTAYNFRVVARDTVGNESSASSTLNVTTVSGSPDGTAPDEPTDLVIDQITDNSMRISWAEVAADDLAGYRVYKSTTSGSGYTEATSIPVSNNSFTVSGLSNGTTYYFVVTAIDDSGEESDNSSEASAATLSQDTTAPDAPANVTVTASSETTLTIKFDPPDDTDVAGYNAYIKTGGSYGSADNSALLKNTAHTFTGLSASTTYYIVVKAVDHAGNVSSASTEINDTTDAPPLYCGTDTVGNHLAAGRAYTFGGYVCRTVGGEDQLPAITYTCAFLRDYGGNPSYTIQETSTGVFDKVGSCP